MSDKSGNDRDPTTPISAREAAASMRAWEVAVRSDGFNTQKRQHERAARLIERQDAELTSLRAEVERLRGALEKARRNFGTYFEYWSAQHEDQECDEADCHCPMVSDVNEAFTAIDAVLSPQGKVGG